MINIIRDLLLFGAKKGLVYLFRDDFTTDRLAGSVNGTPLDGFGGVRTVNDPSNYLSISGGKAQFANGGGAYGNPGMWFPAVTRQPGLLLFWEFTVTTLTSKILDMGIDTDQAGASYYGFVPNGTTALQVRDNGSSFNADNALSGGVSYKAFLLLKSTGAELLLWGGAYSWPTLIYSCDIGSTATMYPVLSNFNATYAADLISSVLYNWLPAPLVNDTFTTAFGVTDGSNVGLGGGGGGINWTQQAGTWTASGGKANASALTGGLAIATVPTATKDVHIVADLTRPTAGNVGLVGRYQDANNYIIAYHDGTNAKVDQVVGGVATNKITGVVALGTRLKMMLDGTNARLWAGTNTHVGASSTLDATLTATTHGVYTTDIGNTFDNFNIKARGTAGEYSQLMSFFL